MSGVFGYILRSGFFPSGLVFRIRVTAWFVSGIDWIATGSMGCIGFGFGVLFISVGTVMASKVKSSGLEADTTAIPVTVQIFGLIMFLLPWQSVYGLTTQKPGYLTSNAVFNLICMLLHTYFACYLWMGLSEKVLQTVPYLWYLGVNIIKFTIVIPMAYEFVVFSMSCYLADVMRNSEPLIEGNPYASFVSA